MMASVEATPVAEVVTTVAQAADPIAEVPSAEVPDAMVCDIVALADGSVIVVESVPARVILFETVSVLPSAIVSVDPVAGAVRATLLMLVADATPSTGVTKVGVPSNTNFPVPVAPVEVTPSMV